MYLHITPREPGKATPVYTGGKKKAGLESALHSHMQKLNAVCDMIGGSILSWWASKKETQNAIHQDFMIQLQTSPWVVN